MQIDKYIYEIDETNTIRVWNEEVPDELGRPFLLQPDYPDGRPWESRAAAEAWIVNLINEWLKPVEIDLEVDEITEPESPEGVEEVLEEEV
jgi:hypothetical protein